MKTLLTTTLNDAQWRAYYRLKQDIRQAWYAHLEGKDQQLSFEEFRSRSLVSAQTLGAHEHVVYPDEASEVPAGWLRYFSGNDDLFFALEYHQPQIPRDFLTLTANLVLKKMCDGNYRKSFTASQDKRLIPAIRSMQPSSEAKLLLMELLPEKVDHSILGKWERAFGDWKDKLRIEFFRDRPDEILDRYVRLNDQLLSDMPLEGRTPAYTGSWTRESLQKLNERNRNTSQTIYSYFLFDEKDELVGISEVSIRLDPLKMIQGMTGLRKDYRGKGLAKIMKAYMIRRLLADFPGMERIFTTTSNPNHQMRHINKSLGFEVRNAMYEFGFDKEDLAAFLEQPVNSIQG